MEEKGGFREKKKSVPRTNWNGDSVEGEEYTTIGHQALGWKTPCSTEPHLRKLNTALSHRPKLVTKNDTDDSWPTKKKKRIGRDVKVSCISSLGIILSTF